MRKIQNYFILCIKSSVYDQIIDKIIRIKNNKIIKKFHLIGNFMISNKKNKKFNENVIIIFYQI